MRRKNSIMGMAFFGPALVLLTLFLFLPMLLTFDSALPIILR